MKYFTNLAPIVLFVYNRPEHTKKTIKALRRNQLAVKSDLIIYCDAPKNKDDIIPNKKVKSVVEHANGFKQVHIVERNTNYGLAKNIIDGVSDVVSSYGKVIVLEDDLITSPYFLQYMNKMLNHYKMEDRVYSISGYNHPSHLMEIPEDYKYEVYFSLRNSSWGWGTWAEPWFKTDWKVTNFDQFVSNKEAQTKFDQGGSDMSDMLTKQQRGEINSWAIRWSYSHFKHDAYAVYPVYSYVNNIGVDGTGMHSGWINIYENDLTKAVKDPSLPPDVSLNEKILENFRRVYNKSLFSKAKKVIKYIVKDFI